MSILKWLKSVIHGPEAVPIRWRVEWSVGAGYGVISTYEEFWNRQDALELINTHAFDGVTYVYGDVFQPPTLVPIYFGEPDPRWPVLGERGNGR